MDGEKKTDGSVPRGAKQAGEVRSRWGWAEPCVWTERMLTALETGVKGGQWFSLIAGPTLTLRNMGCSPQSQPISTPVSPLDGKTLDWRAGCGKAARPVRRAFYYPQLKRLS